MSNSITEFDDSFNSDPECNCQCGCTVPVSGQCVDCSDNTGHQNNYKLTEYDQLNDQYLKRIGER